MTTSIEATMLVINHIWDSCLPKTNVFSKTPTYDQCIDFMKNYEIEDEHAELV